MPGPCVTSSPITAAAAAGHRSSALTSMSTSHVLCVRLVFLRLCMHFSENISALLHISAVVV